MKIIEFKTVSPLFEMERDGIKPFTERQYDPVDMRFVYIKKMIPGCFNNKSKRLIKITNPVNGNFFFRRLIAWEWLLNDKPKWMILYFGELVTPDKS